MSGPRKELERIGRQYREKLPEKLREVHDIFYSIDPVLWPGENVAHLIRRLHALRGSAATFGFTEIAQRATEIEHELALLAARPYGPAEFKWREIGQRIQHLSGMDLNEQQPASSGASSAMQLRDRPQSPLVDLVEDDGEEAQFIAEVLRYAGFHVRHFSSGIEYRKNWNNENFPAPDAIIMDMILPSGDLAGAETITAIKPDHLISPVIFLSQRDDMQARLRALRAGATRYLVKPVDTLHLINLLDALTSRQPDDPYRILLVDDEPKLLEVQAEMLRMSGMSVRTLTNPMQTLETMKAFKPDVLLLDVYMPEVTGPEIAAIIRDSDEHLNLPILFLSAEQDISQQLMALSLGGDDFLVKPLRQDHLVAAVSARARRARQSTVVFERLMQVTERLRISNRTVDQHCLSMVLDDHQKVIAVNQRFEELAHLRACDVESKALNDLSVFRLPEEGLEPILDAAIKNGIWQGRIVLETPSGGVELETTICTSEAREVSRRVEYWLLGSIVPAQSQ